MGRLGRSEGVVARKREREKFGEGMMQEWGIGLQKSGKWKRSAGKIVGKRERENSEEGDAGVGKMGWENRGKGVERGVEGEEGGTGRRGKIRCRKFRGRGYRAGGGDGGGSNGDSALTRERRGERRREGRREELGGGNWKGKSGFVGRKGGRPKVDDESGGGYDQKWGKIGEGGQSWSWRMRSIGG